MHDLGPDSSEYRALAGLENKKGQHTLAWIARAAGLKLFCAFPRPLERFAFLDLALDHARSRLDDGGGWFRDNKYHTRKSGNTFIFQLRFSPATPHCNGSLLLSPHDCF